MYADYWYVETPWNCYTVSLAMARELQRQLTRWPRPAWVSIVDLSGARVLLRSKMIMSLQQSSPESREMWRTFRKERDLESPEDRLGL